MPLSKEEYAKALRSEYIVAEEAARLLAEVEGVLPDAVRTALCELFAADKEGIPDEEFTREARAAVIRELLEYLQTELNPPPRPGLRSVPAKDDMTEEILIKLLRLHFDHNKKVSEVEKHGLELGLFRVNVLDVVLDALAVPGWKEVEEATDSDADKSGGEDAHEPFDRQWCWGTYEEMINEGTEEEFSGFLEAIRKEQRKQA